MRCCYRKSMYREIGSLRANDLLVASRYAGRDYGVLMHWQFAVVAGCVENNRRKVAESEDR